MPARAVEVEHVSDGRQGRLDDGVTRVGHGLERGLKPPLGLAVIVPLRQHVVSLAHRIRGSNPQQPGIAAGGRTADHAAMFNHATAAAPRPVIERAEQANTRHVLGGSLAVHLDRSRPRGASVSSSRRFPAGYPGPAIHVHHDFDETFYVISGEIALRIGGAATVADAGSVVFVPRRTPHTFANPGPAPARMLVLLAPGGFEAYFNALAEVLRTAGGLPEPSELVALGIAHGSLPG